MRTTNCCQPTAKAMGRANFDLLHLRNRFTHFDETWNLTTHRAKFHFDPTTRVVWTSTHFATVGFLSLSLLENTRYLFLTLLLITKFHKRLITSYTIQFIVDVLFSSFILCIMHCTVLLCYWVLWSQSWINYYYYFFSFLVSSSRAQVATVDRFSRSIRPRMCLLGVSLMSAHLRGQIPKPQFLGAWIGIFMQHANL